MHCEKTHQGKPDIVTQQGVYLFKVERLRKEYAAAESEYKEAIASGAVVQDAPKRGRGAGAGKGAGFFDVVKKAQSSLWEDKFKAFKEKQRESATVC